MTGNIRHIHYRTCNLCEAMCGIQIELEHREIIAIKGDKNDPFSKGHICPKATALEDIHNDPNRLKHPVRRTIKGWERISWNDAFEEVVKNLVAIQEKYGGDAVGIYQGNPNAHHLGSILYSPPFVRALRTKNRFSATSVDQLPHHFASYFMFGHQLLMPIPDIDHTEYMLILGANPLVSNGSLMTAAGIDKRLKAIHQRGGKFIVIDPRKTETAKIASEHLFIKPNTDVVFLLAMAHTIFAESLEQLGHLEGHTVNLEKVRELVSDFSPEIAQSITGIHADKIREIARAFATAEKAVCYGRVGLSMQQFGGLCQWLIYVLNIITGHMDSVGGAMFAIPAIDVVGLTTFTGQTGNYGRWKSRVRGISEFGGEIPAATMAEEILTEGPGQIKAMVTVAGNPVLSTPNGEQLDKALSSLEFMVAIDIYVNETTHHANIILPPTTGLETEHYDLLFHNFAVHNTTKYSPALFEPEADTRHDWQIFMALREGLETAKGKGTVFRKDYLKRLPPNKILDLGLRFGPYGGWGGRRKIGNGLTLRKVQKAWHGIDLSPLQPCLLERLATHDKCIQLAPDIFVSDLSRVHEQLIHEQRPTPTDFDLALIGRRQVRSNNSWMHNSERLVRGKNRCTLMIHPDDARPRGFANGQQVVVISRVGRVEIEVEITEDIMPGVVSIPHGWGHHRKNIQLDVAQGYAGVSINDLTDERVLDNLTGNASFSGIPVMVCHS